MAALRSLALVSDGESSEIVLGRARFCDTPSRDRLGWSDAIESYLCHILAMRAADTHRSYKERLSVARQWFVNEANNGAGIRLVDVKMTDVDDFLAARATARNPATGEIIKRSTRRADAIALKAFFKWSARNKILRRNPLADYELPGADKPCIPTPTVEKVAKVLQAARRRWEEKYNPDCRFLTPECRRFYKVRNYCILAGLATSSLRIGELLALLPGDVDLDQGIIRVRISKSGDWREVPIEHEWIIGRKTGSDPAIGLRDWIGLRRGAPERILTVAADGSSRWMDVPLFYTVNYRPILYKSWLNQFHEDLKHAGLKGKFTAHHLRHYSIDTVSEVSMKAASQRAGHASIATTQAYLHKRPEAIARAVEESAPLGQVTAAMARLAGAEKPVVVNKRTVRKPRAF